MEIDAHFVNVASHVHNVDLSLLEGSGVGKTYVVLL